MSPRNTGTLNTKKLMEFAEELPENHPLKTILLLEEKEISIDDFLIKIPIWLKLARFRGR